MADESQPEVPLQSIFGRLDRFVGRPLIALALTTLIGFGLAWWFYPSIDPTYRAYPSDTVARRESPRLTVNWDGRPIDNLCVSRVALWNAGNQPITQDKLPTTDPVRIVPTRTIHILGVELANSSRPTLSLDTQIVASDKTDNVRFAIHGGDALEKGEGVAVRLLFTGDCTSDFQVVGRVIGSSGFRPIRTWTVGSFPQLALLVPVMILLYFGFTFVIGFLFGYLRDRFIKRPGVLVSLLFVVGLGSMASFLIAVGLFIHWVQFGPSLSWLPQ